MIDRRWAALVVWFIAGTACLSATWCIGQTVLPLQAFYRPKLLPNAVSITACTTPNLTSQPSDERTPDGMIEQLTLSVVYDNNVYDAQMKSAWGFACFIETGNHTILFDTGADGPTLLFNMTSLGFAPDEIDRIVLSHNHGDHTGGLADVLAAGSNAVVYIPQSFPASFKDWLEEITAVREIKGPEAVMDGVYTTGEMGTWTVEQALVLKTPQGLIVITGCAHPGIVPMVERAMEVGDSEVHLLLGGFHLGGKSEEDIRAIIEDLQRLRVQKVAPCHCTGQKAIDLFEESYGENSIRSGVGKVITLY